MSRYFVPIVALALGLSAGAATAQTSPAEKEFVRQHLQNIVRVDPERVIDPAVATVFAVPVYRVMIEIGDPNGMAKTSVMVARMGDSLVTVSAPGEEQDCPAIHRLLSKTFKLNGPTAAATMQKALDVVYPISGTSEDEAIKTFKRAGNEWSFVRGKFFDNAMGFVLTTNAAGTITGVRWVLKLPG